MNIKPKSIWIVVIFLVILSVVLWDTDSEDISYDPPNETKATNYGDSFPNIQEPHFTNKTITYSISIDSSYYSEYSGNVKGNDAYEIDRIKWAFQIIEESVGGIIEFVEVDETDNPNILINGYALEQSYDQNFIISGLAGPLTTSDNKILQSSVDLLASNTGLWGGSTSSWSDENWIYTQTEYDYRETISWEVMDCKDFPNTEVHEILHALGIGHNNDNSSSVMFPVKHRIQACKTKRIDEDIVSCLKYIYSNGEVSGSCEGIEIYPWPEEEEIEEIKDFKWDSLPITYSVFDCKDRQKWNIQKAEGVVEKYLGYDIYTFVDNQKSDVNFYCHDSFGDVLLNYETDFWDTTVYFPAAQPYFYFDGDKINEVKILLFAQERPCGGIEVHELLHGLGLREHYGHWMEYETELCDTRTLVIGTKSLNKTREIYNL